MNSKMHTPVHRRIKLLVLVILTIKSYGAYGQLNQKQIDILSNELSLHVNVYRQSLGLQNLTPAEPLTLAAQLHSDYMAKESDLGHTEKRSQTKTPDKRVKFCKGENFELIGENVAQTAPCNNKLKKEELVILARQIFEQWRGSKPHNDNMTESEYTLCSYGFQINPKTQIIYATQVFGKAQFKLPGQLSKNAFGIREGADHCLLDEWAGEAIYMGNSVNVQGDSIVLWYYDVQLLKSLISGPNDGFAIDLIHRDQMVCGKSNELDGSPVYDGIMLKPVYRDQLFKNNQAQGEYRFIGSVGMLPPDVEYNASEWSISLIIIKNNQRCAYITPMWCEQENYAMVDIGPELIDVPEIPFKKSGVVKTLTLHYDFHTSDNQAMQFPHLGKLKGNVHQVDITSYSSIDGDSLRNQALYQQRASTIRTHIQSHLNVSNEKFRVTGKENWEEMVFQLHMLGKEDWLELPRDTLRYFSRNLKDSLNWDSLLFFQRQSSANIHYWDKFSPDDYPGETVASMNLRTAVILNDPKLANKSLYAMYHQDNEDMPVLFESAVIHFFEKHVECVGNYAALLCKTSDKSIEQVTRFLHHWIQSPEGLSEGARTNLAILYTKVSGHYIDRWDVHKSRLANVVHPRKFDIALPNEISPELLLNLRISNINYFGQINDYISINMVFNSLNEHFSNLAHSEADDLALTRFYNYWSWFDGTVHYLVKQFNKGKLSHDRLFMLNFTMNRISALRSDDKYLEVHQAAIESDKELWCNYLNTHFQMLRDYRIKRLYCENCR